MLAVTFAFTGCKSGENTSSANSTMSGNVLSGNNDSKQTSVENDECVHSFSAATCTEPKTCIKCGASEGAPLGHEYKNGKCVRCNAEDPNHTKTYDAYVNGAGYDLGTTLTVDIVFKTSDKEIFICPCWTAYQKINNNWEPYNIENAVGIDNIYGEDIDVYSTSGSPIQTDDGAVYGNWAWLANENGEPITGDYSGGKVIKRITFKVCDKGEYKIEVKDGKDADQNDNKYTNSLSLNIHK